MAVNGVVKDCVSHVESDWFDPTEETYESFENISPCKKEDLQSPAIAGHGVFHPVMKTDHVTVYDDTMSMLIINATDYPTQLEASNGDAVEVPIKIQVEPPSEGEITNGSMLAEPVSLANSTVSSVSLADELADAPSEMDLLENEVSKPLQMRLEALPMPQEVVSAHFPTNFLVSAESTPLKPYEHNTLMTKGYLHDYLKGSPRTAPIGEMEGSLELSTEEGSILCDPSSYESVQSEVLEIKACMAMQTSFVSNYDQDRKDCSAEGERTVLLKNLDITPTKAKQFFQEPSTTNEFMGETDGAEENSEDVSSVMEKPTSDQIPAERPHSEQEVSSGEECDHGDSIPNQDPLSAEEEIEVKPEEKYIKRHKLERIAHSSAEDCTAAKIDHPPPHVSEDVADVRHSWQTAMAAGSKAETEGFLTSIALETNPFETKLAPASSLWTTERDGAVKLRMDTTGPAAEPPLTLHQMFQRTIKRYDHRPALAMKKDGVWETLSYLEYHQHCRAAAKGFLKLGLERFHGVGILGFNSPEWFISDIGAIMAGGFAVGIYTTNSPEACQYVAENCDANILVVENHRQLAKILQIQDQLPHLKAIIQYHDELKEPKPNLYTWKDFLQLGTEIPDSYLDEIIASQKANQCCTLIYTSGTTGQPKGAMLSHDNLTWVVKQAGKTLGLGSEQEVIVSYLPLSHIAAQILDIWIPMCFGGVAYFADPDALKGSLVTTLREVRPTGFLGVPRVWEKIQEKMKSMGAKASTIQRKVAAWAKAIGLQASYNRMNGISSMPWGYTLSNILVFRRVHAALGLDRCVRCYTGAAPITKDTLEYFMSLNLPVLELYGMSESTGPHTLSTLNAFRIMSTGKDIPGCKTLINKPEEDGTGEICFWGRHIFMGYLNMEDKTKEALDEEGWLQSGDLGKLDDNGFLYITGRIKELIITAGGENIPPIPIEDAVKEELPIISNAMLIGDKMKFLSMLLTLKCKADADTGEPQDDLLPEVIQFCQRLGSPVTRVSEVVGSKDQAVYKAIQDGIDRVNRRATSNAQRVQKWTILEKDFSLPGGELGPTMKLKRPVVSKMYAEQIENFYKE